MKQTVGTDNLKQTEISKPPFYHESNQKVEDENGKSRSHDGRPKFVGIQE